MSGQRDRAGLARLEPLSWRVVLHPLARLARTNANASGFDSEDSPSREILLIRGKHVERQFSLSASGNIYKANDAVVRQITADREFAEILVLGDQYPTLGIRLRKNLSVAWILRQVAHPNDFMSGSSKSRFGAAPDARIKYQFHAASMGNGSMRS